MKILIPSYKRAGRVKVRKWLEEAVICCHEFEEVEYRDFEGGEIAVIPDHLRGNMANIRNWMLEYGYQTDHQLVFMDDDVDYIGYWEGGVVYKLSAHAFQEWLAKGFALAEEWGCKLWGVNVQKDPKFYHQWKPISLTSPILGTFSAVLQTALRYDSRLSLNEDYDFFLQNIYQYRKCLRFDKYHYAADHIDKAGGCGSYRTMVEEEKRAAIMVQKWGDKVVKYNFKRSFNPLISVPF